METQLLLLETGAYPNKIRDASHLMQKMTHILLLQAWCWE